MKPRIAIVTPALAAANNGNWHTARRWAQMLARDYECDIALSLHELPNEPQAYAAMIALHAKRSATSVQDFARLCPASPIILALTGTDLYRDIAISLEAQRSLQLAHSIVVLQEQALFDVPAPYRSKVRVVFQSCPSPVLARKKPVNKPFQLAVVGHLRAEKAPETVFSLAAHLAASHAQVCIAHVGAGLDATLAEKAQRTQADYPDHYRWLGALTHEISLEAIAKADLLLHPSIMEGGANVIIEAVQHATPVIASRIAGNIGMLGADYAGYFELGDDAACARAVLKAATEADFLAHLTQQCALRSHLFLPEQEENAMQQTVRAALQSVKSFTS